MDGNKREDEVILSISIAAYNVEAYLRKCVESCFVSEEYRGKIEVIIVNDGSQDNTLQIADELKKERPDMVKVIDKKNGGYGSTINAALEVAVGRYFKVLDGDDWFDTMELEKLLEDMGKRDEELVLMDYSVRYMDGDEILRTKTCTFSEFKSDICFSSSQLHGVYVTHFSSAIKTELLQKSGIRILESCFYTDHMYILYCLIFADTVVYIQNNVYQYRMGRDGQSVSLKGILNHLGDNWKVLQAELDYVETYKSKLAENKLELVNAYMAILAKDVIGYHLLSKCTKEGKETIKKMDQAIKQKNLRVYENMERISRPARLLRLSGYSLYRICHYNEMRKHR